MTLSKWEIKMARRLGVSSSDVHKARTTTWGTVYGLTNDYYLTEQIFMGYSKAEIYRALLRKLIKQIGITEA